MEKVLAILDSDEMYLSRFSDYLKKRRQLPFSVRTFHNENELASFARSKPVDLVVSGNKDGADRLRSLVKSKFVMLTDHNSDQELYQGHSIYKYQSSDNIVRDIMGIYGDITGYRDDMCKGAGVACLVFSPIGRSGKTAFSLALATELSKRAKTLYISLEEIPFIKNAMSKDTMQLHGTLTDALYFFKQGRLDSMKLESLLYEYKTAETSFRYIPGATNPEDISALTEKELIDFVSSLKCSGYQYLVIDSDSILSRFAPLFQVCDTVFIPEQTGNSDTRKLQAMTDYLESSYRPEALEEKFVHVLLQDSDVKTSSLSPGLMYEDAAKSHTQRLFGAC